MILVRHGVVKFRFCIRLGLLSLAGISLTMRKTAKKESHHQNRRFARMSDAPVFFICYCACETMARKKAMA